MKNKLLRTLITLEFLSLASFHLSCGESFVYNPKAPCILNVATNPKYTIEMQNRAIKVIGMYSQEGLI